MEPLYPECRARFCAELAGEGFKLLVTSDTGTEHWGGTIDVDWYDHDRGKRVWVTHKIRVWISRGFPFDQPDVIAVNDPNAALAGRHQTPLLDDLTLCKLCLWPTDRPGWDPGMTASDLLARTREWFVHCHQNDWSAQDRPPDLHLSFSGFPGDKPSPLNKPHPLMLIGNNWHPPLGARSGQFGIWGVRSDCLYAGSAQPENVTPPMKVINEQDGITLALGLNGEKRTRTGIWLRLDQEPVPYLTWPQLLDEIDRVSGHQGWWALHQIEKLRGRNQHGTEYTQVISLGYPTADGEQWLFLEMDLPRVAKGIDWTQPQIIARQTKSVRSYAAVPISELALVRRTAHTAQAVQGKNVLIFGQGAIGSSISLLLAKAGVPGLTIVDGDDLLPGNVVRHAASMVGVGQEKTSAVSFEIRIRAPFCKVQRREPTWDPDILGGWVRSTNLVVDATANTNFSLLLNEVCLHENRPAVYVTAHRNAAIGRVRVVRPGRDACLSCYHAGHADNPEYPVILPGKEHMEFVEVGCGDPTTQASALDMEAVANWATRAALWLMTGQLGDRNHCLVVNRDIDLAPPFPLGLGIHWSRWEPIEGCAACGGLNH